MSFTSDSERATAGHVETQPPSHAERTAPRGVNVAIYLAKMAEAMPAATAVVEPRDYDRQGKRRYRTVTFRELDDDSSRIARAFRIGGQAGHPIGAPGPARNRLCHAGLRTLQSRGGHYSHRSGHGPDVVAPVSGRSGPGGVNCHSIRPCRAPLVRGRFPKSRIHVTVGRRWFWGGVTLAELRAGGQFAREGAAPLSNWEAAATGADDPAAIIFTTGSTGPPKGVLFTHGNFNTQVEEIRDFYGIQPGEIDLAAFPLFGLFNGAMGATTVIPDMNPSRPALVDPEKIIEAVRDWKVTQAFGSPAIWNRVGKYCEAHGVRLATVRRVLSAGDPVPADVLARMKACIHPQGNVHTPYGATESLPVASISASEILGETTHRTRDGLGVCVGRRFARMQWKVIRIVNGPIESLDRIEEMPCGEIGELIVCGPVVTRQYVTRLESNALGKIADGPRIWHRMGDAGYLDANDRFWFCGRLAHRVLAAGGPMYTIPCEAIFNQHPSVCRSALVGVGPPGAQRPVIILEPMPNAFPRTTEARHRLLTEIRCLGQSKRLTSSINDFLFHPGFPVDIRHNAKIFREKLALWAAKRLGSPRCSAPGGTP